MAQRREAALQRGEHLLLREVAELLAEALEVAEHLIVDDAHQPEEFEERVLERRDGQQQLRRRRQGLLQRVRDDVRRLVDVAQPVRFVHHHEVPRGVVDVGCLVPRELVRADDDVPVSLEGAELAGLDGVVVGLRFEDAAGQEELVRQLLMPLLPQIRRRDHEDAPLALRPPLRQHEPRLDRLAEPDFVGQQHTARERRPEREQRRVDLVGVQVDLCVHERGRQPVVAVRWAAARQLVRVVLRVVRRQRLGEGGSRRRHEAASSFN
jgi:hypothetical protein